MKTSRKHPFNFGLRGGAIALVLATFTLVACQTPEDTAGTGDQDTTEQTAQDRDQQTTDAGHSDVQVGDLSGDLEDYLGQTVSVRGEVVETIGEEAFVISGGGLFSGDDVVVFNASGNPMPQIGDDVTERVQVTGEVQQVVIDDIAQQHGLMLDEETYGEYEGNPAIIAGKIALAPDPGEISDNPEAFFDQLIAVEGGVGEQYDANVFTISQAQFLGGSDILVIKESAAMVSFDDNDDVVILGTLRPFDLAQLEREYNLMLDDNQRQTIESDYSDEPILVADQVYPINR